MKYHVTCSKPMHSIPRRLRDLEDEHRDRVPMIVADPSRGFVTVDEGTFAQARLAARCTSRNICARCEVRDQGNTILLAFNTDGNEITWRERG